MQNVFFSTTVSRQKELCNYTNIDKMYGCAMHYFCTRHQLSRKQYVVGKRYFATDKVSERHRVFITFLPAFKCCFQHLYGSQLINDKVEMFWFQLSIGHSTLTNANVIETWAFVLLLFSATTKQMPLIIIKTVLRLNAASKCAKKLLTVI